MDRAQLISDYINVRANSVEGWFYPVDMALFYYLDQTQKEGRLTGDLCEVGVYKGKSLAYLGMLARDEERIHAFDLFPEDYLERTKEVMARFCPWQPAVQYISGDTAEYSAAQLRQLVQRQLRMLHIDAGHEYHEVLHTLYHLAPFVDDTGIIIMDDYQDREFPGVGAAVLDFCQQQQPRQFVPFLAGANKMYLCSPSMAAYYQRGVLFRDGLKDTMRLSRIRDNVVLVAQSKLPMHSDTIARLLGSDLPDYTASVDLDALAAKAKRNAQNAIAAANSRG